MILKFNAMKTFKVNESEKKFQQNFNYYNSQKVVKVLYIIMESFT